MDRTAIASARDVLDQAVLTRLLKCTVFGQYETFIALKWIAMATELPIETVRAICRDLTDRGLARYARGLFTEDGMAAGAGYGITPKGHRYLIALRELYRRD